MACTIKWHKRGVYLKYSGKVSLNDILEVGNILLSDRRYDSCIYEVSDFTLVTEVEISEQDVKVIATWDKTAANFVHLKYLIMIIDKREFYHLADKYFAIMNEINLKTAKVQTIEQAKKILQNYSFDLRKETFE